MAANDNRDALAKAIYSKLFARIIEQINAAFAAGGEGVDVGRAGVGEPKTAVSE